MKRRLCQNGTLRIYLFIITTGIPCSAGQGGEDCVQWIEIDPWILVLEVALTERIYRTIIVQNS